MTAKESDEVTGPIRGRRRDGWLGIVLGTPDPRGLARFYERLLGWPISTEADDWVTMQVRDLPVNLAFQLEENHVPPAWPGGPGDQQMQLHLDIAVEDLEAAVADAQQLGATVADFQPQDDVRVLSDPAGHPFCLYVDRGE
ncbi:hypothetical protein B0O41_1035 [Propionibacteriaceae bacterium ES.041]|uniref:VOC family protein n=1 Tax=Enemella evansiae TaxID=2016499 RepID=UPI000B965DA5|nr:VOC family protein [Enemella evansiae]OYN95049.1 glyoxalase [Enemella evansiae]PFG66252.1 hypothetical protein B0O41_1035 [Propionibacteriaceae bacterium ES.041]